MLDLEIRSSVELEPDDRLALENAKDIDRYRRCRRILLALYAVHRFREEDWPVIGLLLPQFVVSISSCATGARMGHPSSVPATVWK